MTCPPAFRAAPQMPDGNVCTLGEPAPSAPGLPRSGDDRQRAIARAEHWRTSHGRAGGPARGSRSRAAVATGIIVVATAPLQDPGTPRLARGLGPSPRDDSSSAVRCPHAVALLPAAGAPHLPAATLWPFAHSAVYGNGLGAAYVGVYVLAFVYVGLFTPPTRAGGYCHWPWSCTAPPPEGGAGNRGPPCRGRPGVGTGGPRSWQC